jgi:hypothetical protein
MEQRPGKRQPTDNMVTIGYAPLGIISARMTSLSCDGIHVETGPIRLKVGQHVEIFFRQADGGLLALKALTLHTSQQGTVLNFTEEDAPRQIADIQHPLYCAA